MVGSLSLPPVQLSMTVGTLFQLLGLSFLF